MRPIDICNNALALLGESFVTDATFTVTAASGNGTTVTLTTGAHPFVVGNTIYVSGNSQSDVNGYAVLTAVTSTTVSFANTETSPGANGTVQAAFPYDNNKQANTFNKLWRRSILCYTLNLAPWNPLKVRTVLSQPELTVTGGTANGTTITLTVGAHTLLATQTIYLSGTVTSGGTWDGTYILTAVTATTITFSSSLTGTWTSGGTVTWSPLFDFSYIYTLPSNLLRPLKVNSVGVSNFYQYNMYGAWWQLGSAMPPFRIEGNYLLSSEQVVNLLYMSWDNTFFSAPDDDFLDSLITHRAAAVMALPLNRDPGVIKQAKADYESELFRCKFINSQSGTPEEFQESSLILNRF